MVIMKHDIIYFIICKKDEIRMKKRNLRIIKCIKGDHIVENSYQQLYTSCETTAEKYFIFLYELESEEKW